MTNQQLAKREVCAKCGSFDRCEIHHGKACKRQGGDRIPRERPPKKFEATVAEEVGTKLDTKLDGQIHRLKHPYLLAGMTDAEDVRCL